MCVFCDDQNLRLLSVPLDELAAGDLARAVRTAREAAHVGMLKHAEAALAGFEPGGELEPTLYADVVLARAEEAGVLDRAGMYAWSQRLATTTGLRDPRVQAFLACGAEVVDDYRHALPERQQVLARFLEVAGTAVRFSHIGDDGELWFDCGNEAHTALRRNEAMDIVDREISRELHTIPPAELLHYTELPDTAADALATIQKHGEDEANAILAGVVDIAALAADRLRMLGFAEFFRRGKDNSGSIESAEFGAWILLREPR